MRFEWLALMAFKRLTVPGDQAWVTLEEIARLPSWSGRSRHHIATNVGRYLESLEANQIEIVEARTRWAGPYRLNRDSLSFGFDVPLLKARKLLQLRHRLTSFTQRDELIRFTFSFARAQWLLFQGRLIRQLQKQQTGDSAYERLMQMSADRSYRINLRLLACLSAVDVLYRLGRIRVARQTLLQNIPLLRRTPDSSLKARSYLKLAWAYQRAASGKRSDRAVEDALRKAASYAENSGDRDSLGLLSHRTAGHLAKKGFTMEAVSQFCLALEAYLVTGNYDMVQATCGNIGSMIHRLGPEYYPEARRWLLLSITISRWMRLGGDNAHAVIILGKIYVEQGESSRSRWLLQRAERRAERAGNQVNVADVKMVWGFWYRRFGTREQQIGTLVSALKIFRKITEFDLAEKERYMGQRFPDVWQEVLEAAEPSDS